MEDKREHGKNIVIVILFLLLIIAIVFLGIYKFRADQPVRTAVLEAINADEMTLNQDGMVDIDINQFVTVINGVMQDLKFKNANTYRLLQCQIRQGDKYIYDSGKLEPGTSIVGDFVKTDNLKQGENNVIAEITSYSLDGTKRMQINVEMVLIYIS